MISNNYRVHNITIFLVTSLVTLLMYNTKLYQLYLIFTSNIINYEKSTLLISIIGINEESNMFLKNYLIGIQFHNQLNQVKEYYHLMIVLGLNQDFWFSGEIKIE